MGRISLEPRKSVDIRLLVHGGRAIRMSSRYFRMLLWPTAVLLVLGVSCWLYYNSRPRLRFPVANAAGNLNPSGDPDDDDRGPPPDTTNVKVIRPRSGAMERITVQVGSVQADEVDLFAQVTGV